MPGTIWNVEALPMLAKVTESIPADGSFLYEPAGSVHTLECIEDDTHVWFQIYGQNLNLGGELAAALDLVDPGRLAPRVRARRRGRWRR